MILTASSITEQDAIDAFLAKPGEDTYRTLFDAVCPRIFNYFRLRGCARTVAEDLTQEVMLAVYTQNSLLRERRLFRPWIFRIARNLWLQHLRHEQRRPAIALEEIDCQNLFTVDGDPLLSSCIAESLATLPREEQDLILMRYVEGLEYHEIAEALGLPLGTVQWRIFHIRRKLAAHFSRHPA